METTIDRPRPDQRTFDFAVVPPEMVLRLPSPAAQDVFALLTEACGYSDGRYEPVTTLRACAGQIEGYAEQLWIAGYRGGAEPPSAESIAVTTIRIYPTGLRVLELLAVAGKTSRAWLHFADGLADFAAKNGCHRVQMLGRKSWMRTLDESWRATAQLFERDVT